MTDSMGAYTQRHIDSVDSVVSESYVYSPNGLSGKEKVKRVKVTRTLWDTGASATLISKRVVDALKLKSVGKSGVSGYNNGVDVKNTYLIHLGLPTGDIVTNVVVMEFDSEDYDVVIGMDVICQGDMALTNKDGNTTFPYRVPSKEEIVF